jgi:uncharacterized MAPEG superfamily protein
MTDLHWLAATCLVTALCWLPYVLNRVTVIGLGPALGNPKPEHRPLSEWAQRMKAAHSNGVENLVVFAPLLLIANAMGLSGDTTLMLSKVYFLARIAHYIVYTMGLPVARTLAFAIGWLATLCMAAVVFGGLS